MGHTSEVTTSNFELVYVEPTPEPDPEEPVTPEPDPEEPVTPEE
jgi:hypothetical protein